MTTFVLSCSRRWVLTETTRMVTSDLRRPWSVIVLYPVESGLFAKWCTLQTPSIWQQWVLAIDCVRHQDLKQVHDEVCHMLRGQRHARSPKSDGWLSASIAPPRPRFPYYSGRRYRVLKWALLLLFFVCLFVCLFVCCCFFGGEGRFRDCAVQVLLRHCFVHAKWPTLAWFVCTKKKSEASVIYPKTDYATEVTHFIADTKLIQNSVIWIGRSKMNIRQIRNTIFTIAKPERQTISHSSGDIEALTFNDSGSDSDMDLSYHCLLVSPGLFPLLSSP